MNEEVPAVEAQVARDMVTRVLPAAPVIVLVAGLVRGGAGAWSAAAAVLVVTVNLVGSAVSLGWAARRSPAALMGTALGGFLVRMIVLTLAVWAVKGQAWADLPTLAVTILVTHLGLLFWETRYVSANLAFPGLKPAPRRRVDLPVLQPQENPSR